MPPSGRCCAPCCAPYGRAVNQWSLFRLCIQSQNWEKSPSGRKKRFVTSAALAPARRFAGSLTVREISEIRSLAVTFTESCGFRAKRGRNSPADGSSKFSQRCCVPTPREAADLRGAARSDPPCRCHRPVPPAQSSMSARPSLPPGAPRCRPTSASPRRLRERSASDS